MRSLKLIKNGRVVSLQDGGEITIDDRKFHVSIDFDSGHIELEKVCDEDGDADVSFDINSLMLNAEPLSAENRSTLQKPFINGAEHTYRIEPHVSLQTCYDCLSESEKANGSRVTVIDGYGLNSQDMLNKSSFALFNAADKYQNLTSLRALFTGFSDYYDREAKVDINSFGVSLTFNNKDSKLVNVIGSELAKFVSQKSGKSLYSISGLVAMPLDGIDASLIASAKSISFKPTSDDDVFSILSILKTNRVFTSLNIDGTFSMENGFRIVLSVDRLNQTKRLAISSRQRDDERFFAMAAHIDAIFNGTTLEETTLEYDGETQSLFRLDVDMNPNVDRTLRYASSGYFNGYVSEATIKCDSNAYCFEGYAVGGYAIDKRGSSVSGIAFGDSIVEKTVESGYCDGYCEEFDIPKSTIGAIEDAAYIKSYLFGSNEINSDCIGSCFDEISTCYDIGRVSKFRSFYGVQNVKKSGCSWIATDDMSVSERVQANRESVSVQIDSEIYDAIVAGAKKVRGSGIKYIRDETITCSQSIYDKLADKIRVKEVNFTDNSPKYPCYFGKEVESVTSADGKFSVLSYWGGYKHNVTSFNQKSESPYVAHIVARDQNAEYDKVVAIFSKKDKGVDHGYIDKEMIDSFHSKIDAEVIYRFVAGADVKHAVSKIATPFYPPARVLLDAYKTGSDRMFVSFKIEGNTDDYGVVFNAVNEYEDLSDTQSCGDYETANSTRYEDSHFYEHIHKTSVVFDMKTGRIIKNGNTYTKSIEKRTSTHSEPIDTVLESGSLSDVYSPINIMLETVYSSTGGDYEIVLNGIESIDEQVERLAKVLRERVVTKVITNRTSFKIDSKGSVADVANGGKCFNTTTTGFSLREVYMDDVGDAILPQVAQPKKSDIVKYSLKREGDGSILIEWDTSNVDDSKLPYFMHFNGAKIPIKKVV